MSTDPFDLQSDAPPTTYVRQRELAEETADDLGWDEAAVVGRSITINRPREEVYRAWRDFEGLAKFMENIQSVSVGEDGVSHWVVAAPAGRSVEWDAVITEDVPGALIAWESVAGADIKNIGRVEFADAAPGRGVVVTATIIYDPPAGQVGQMIAKLFQREPKMQARRDLRRFKQLLETGEIATSENHRS